MAASPFDPSAEEGRSDSFNTAIQHPASSVSFLQRTSVGRWTAVLIHEAFQVAGSGKELGSREVRIAEHEALESGREVVAEDACRLLGRRGPGQGRRILRKPVREDPGLLLVHHQPEGRHHRLEDGGWIATLGLTVLLQNLELSLELVERQRKEVGYVGVASHQPERPALPDPTDQDSGTALLDRPRTVERTVDPVEAAI